MFRGLAESHVDAKGRVAIPSRYRDIIQKEAGGMVVVTIDVEAPCLLLYPYPQWEKIEQKLETLPSFHPVTRRIQRLLIGHATELEVDRSGRILIPSLLREYAHLGQTVTWVGQVNKIEIWGKQWNDARQGWLDEGLQWKNDEDDFRSELKTLSL